MSYFLACLSIAIACVAGSNAAAEKPAYLQVRELIVRYDDSADPGASPESIVAAINSSARSQAERALAEHLQSPQAARFAIRDRLDARTKGLLKPTSPQYLLQKYVVLTYPNPIVADIALTRLREDPRVLSIEENRLFEFSTTTLNDPLSQGNDEAHQWGLYALNMFSAWDRARGHAYVGVIDNGIQLSHSELVGFRSHFSPNYGLGTTNDELDLGLDAQGQPRTSNFAGHGTHVAGIIGAAQNTIGTAGICWNCSLMITKANTWDDSHGVIPSLDAIANALSFLSGSGAQVVNMSFGTRQSTCQSNPQPVLCIALQYAVNREVLAVAAAGNLYDAETQFPASDSRTLAVGGVQLGANYPAWQEAGPPFADSDFTGTSRVPLPSDLNLAGVVAPAKNIYSTFYAGHPWNPNDRCGDGFPAGSSATDGFGHCSGTSMAAPHITGLAGILRSINPLLSQYAIRQIIVSSSSRKTSPAPLLGMGVPDASLAVNATLATTSTLTPLFSFQSVYDQVNNPQGGAQNYFYTTVPQLASAALSGELLPYVTRLTNNVYDPVGTPISTTEYSGFPTPVYSGDATARAQAWIFSTHVNPVNSAYPLVALTRLSRKCGDSGSIASVCASYPYHVDHTYASEPGDIAWYTSQGYKIDGVEGYIHSKAEPQPPDSVRLYRKYNPSRDDRAIFPESLDSAMGVDGYSAVDNGNSWLGWVYANTDGRRPYVGPPTPISPVGTIATTTPAYSWHASLGAASYTLLVQNLNGVAVNQSIAASTAGCASGMGICTYTPATALSSQTAYSWFVNAANNQGTTLWSPGSAIFVNALGPSPPSAPVGISPQGTIYSITPTYNWYAVAGTDDYYLVVQNLSSNPIHQTYAASVAGCASGSGTCSVTPSVALDMDTTYSWFVRGTNTVGTGPFSEGKSITVRPTSVPVAPILVAPSGTIATTTPTYVWNASAQASSYELLVQNTSGVRLDEVISAATAGCGSGTGTCTYTPATSLLSNTAYSWFLKASNSLGTSAWSSGTPIQTQ